MGTTTRIGRRRPQVFNCARFCATLLRKWSEWQDLNLRPPRPERGALPDCATLRLTNAGIYTYAHALSSAREERIDTQPMSAARATQLIRADAVAIERAARALAQGQLVAFPT